MTEHKVTFTFPDGERVISATEDETLLVAAHRQGLKIVAECELGLCGTCKATKVEGEIAVDQEDPAGLTLMDLRNNGILTCQTYARSDLKLRLGYKMEMISQAQDFAFDALILALEPVAGSVIKVTVDAKAASEFQFLPGQYANLVLPGADLHRSYSFSSSPQKTDTLEFLIRVLPSGLMSDYLRDRAAVGQSLRVTGPYGTFFLHDGTAPLLFIAGGTGLGPFLSMLDYLVATGQTKRQIQLLYGVNDRKADLSSLDRLDEFKAKLSGFNYDIAVAAPDGEWQGKSGFVTALLDDSFLCDGQAEAYLCGPPPMVEAVVKWLTEHGLNNERIYFERFTAS